jgi:uncharacterized DUF497 family protein
MWVNQRAEGMSIQTRGPECCIDIRHTLMYALIMDKVFDWNQDKNRKLARERGISFEAVVSHIEGGNLLAIVRGRGKFRHQKQLIVLIGQYVYVVPCIEEEGRIFLKTIIPSRKMTKRFLSGGANDETAS